MKLEILIIQTSRKNGILPLMKIEHVNAVRIKIFVFLIQFLLVNPPLPDRSGSMEMRLRHGDKIIHKTMRNNGKTIKGAKYYEIS